MWSTGIDLVFVEFCAFIRCVQYLQSVPFTQKEKHNRLESSLGAFVGGFV